MDLSDIDLSDVNLVDQSVDLSVDGDLLLLVNNNLLVKLSDNLLNECDSAWFSWSDIDLLRSLGDMSDLSNDGVDNLSNVNDLLVNNNDLLLEDVNLLDEYWSLFWLLLNLNVESVDLLLDDSQLSNQMYNLLDVSDNSLLVLLVNNSLWRRMETSEVWSSESVQLGLDESVWLVTGFSFVESGNLFTFIVDLLTFADQVLDLSLVFDGMSTGIDWLEKLMLLVSDTMDDSLLLSDVLLDNSDLLNKNSNLLLENINSLDISGLLSDVGSLADKMSDVGDLSSNVSDLLNILLNNNSLLDDGLVDLGDLGSFLLGEDRDWLSSDDSNLMVNLSNSSSDINNLLGNSLQNLSVLLDLLDKNNSLSWLSDDLSSDSSDCSSDDNSLGDKFVNSNSEGLDDLSEFDNLLLNWLWSQTHLAWGLKFLTVMSDSTASGVAFTFLAGQHVNLVLDAGEVIFSSFASRLDLGFK